MSDLKPKPIPVSVILEKFRLKNEQNKYSFPTEYGVENPNMGFDRRRYLEESRPLTESEKWKQYLTN